MRDRQRIPERISSVAVLPLQQQPQLRLLKWNILPMWVRYQSPVAALHSPSSFLESVAHPSYRTIHPNPIHPETPSSSVDQHHLHQPHPLATVISLARKSSKFLPVCVLSLIDKRRTYLRLWTRANFSQSSWKRE